MVKTITWKETGKQILEYRIAEVEYLDAVQNQHFWVANCDRAMGAYKIHFSTCPFINGRAGLKTARHYTDRQYYKLCCEDRCTLMAYIESQGWSADYHSGCCGKGYRLAGFFQNVLAKGK